MLGFLREMIMKSYVLSECIAFFELSIEHIEAHVLVGF